MDRRRLSYASIVGGTSGASNSTSGGGASHLMYATPQSPIRNSYQPSIATERASGAYPFVEDTSKSKYTLWDREISAQTPWHDMEEVQGLSQPRMAIRPSYLAGSKYLERLDALHKAKLARQAGQSTPSLSKSPSGTSLHRMEPSHRGMTYEIVEHSPPEIGDDLTPPLPSKWGERDRNGGLEIASNTDLKFVVTHKGHEQEVGAARSDHFIPRRCGVYYYEITVQHKPKDGMIAIGFSTQKASLEKLPGGENESWAYHGDEGKCYSGSPLGRSYGPTILADDIVGCGVNFGTGKAFFTRNGGFLDYAFTDLKEILRHKNIYASVGMKRPGAHIHANFGQAPFAFDIDGYVRLERMAIRKKITESSLRTLHPTYNEPELIAELVSQYLQHNGFVTTADSFIVEVAQETASLRQDPRPIMPQSLKHDPNAMQRQQIRSAILAGNIDEALNLTSKCYPTVLDINPTILFELKCRKFIEMMRVLPSTSSSNVPRDAHETKPRTGSEMEIDGQEGSGESNQYTLNAALASGDQFQRAIEYGQRLTEEYKTHDSKKVSKALNEIFALFAYADPQNPSAAKLLDVAGRLSVAESLNSAILSSLGAPSTTALELIYQQTYRLLEDNVDHGGSGALINLEKNIDRNRYSQQQIPIDDMDI